MSENRIRAKGEARSGENDKASRVAEGGTRAMLGGVKIEQQLKKTKTLE